MGKKEKINEAKKIYEIELSAIQNDVNRWKNFLKFSSEFYKYSFIENLLMFAQRPDVTMCATIEQWNSVGRWVNRGTKGIRLIDNQDDEITLKYVFDVNDTHGNEKVLFRKWTAEQQQIIDILKDYFHYNNYNNLKDIITMYIYEHFDNNRTIKGLTEMEKEELTTDFLENNINFVTYCVAKRSGIYVDENELFKNFSNVKNKLQLRLIGSVVNDFSNDILRVIEYKIREKNKEVRNNAKTKQVWNGNQKKYGGELSVEIPRASYGRNNNGQIIGERERDNTEKAPDRGRTEEKISTATNKRIFSDCKIQPNDRGNDGGIAKNGDRGENLGVEENSTSFSFQENNVADEYIQGVLKSSGNIKNTTKKINTNDAQLNLFNDDFENRNNIKNEQIEENFVTKDEVVTTNNEDIERIVKGLVGYNVYVENKIYTVQNVNFEKNEVELSDFEMSKVYPLTRILSVDMFYDYYMQNEKNAEMQKEISEIINEKENTDEQKTIQEEQIINKESQKINYHIPEDFTKQYNQKVKYKENIDAIKLLKELEANNRMATSEEQSILAKYNGWGGLSKVFDDKDMEWKAEYTELQKLLTEDEYERARATVLDSFYTDKNIIKAIYNGLERLGFKRGNILEPSAGIGNFIGNIPKSMEDSKFTAIEIDDLTGRILRQLYQKEQVYIQGYEKADLPDNFYDIVISNVPFGNIGIFDKKYNKENFKIHDYFFAKSIDKVRTGGIIAFITTSNTMDKINPTAREYIAKRAKLLGAIRLPTNAFRTVANTDVTTDIIFLQKREQILEDERPSWVDIAKMTDEIYINTYFKTHPDMVMGNFKEDTNRFNKKIYNVVYDKDKQNLQDMLAEAINKLPENVYTELKQKKSNIDDYIIAPNDIKDNSYAVIDDKLYYKEHSVMKLVDKRPLIIERIIGMVKIRDVLDKLISVQSKEISNEEIKPYQAKLNQVYDQFVKKYGIINSSANKLAFEDDSEYQLICALENIDEETKKASKTDIFYKRTIEPNKMVEKVETSDEALIVSLNQKGYVDLNYMAEISNKDSETLIEELEGKIYRNPLVEEKDINEIEVGWETAEEYLSGDVVEKLAIAEAKCNDNEMYLKNVRALKNVQPIPLQASDIEVKLRRNLDTNILYRTICKRKI